VKRVRYLSDTFYDKFREIFNSLTSSKVSEEDWLPTSYRLNSAVLRFSERQVNDPTDQVADNRIRCVEGFPRYNVTTDQTGKGVGSPN
jgi:hypothetical protein